MTSNLPEAYQAYLLRLWQIERNEHWRISLKNIHTGEWQGFANLNELIFFLQAMENPDFSDDKASIREAKPSAPWKHRPVKIITLTFAYAQE